MYFKEMFGDPFEDAVFSTALTEEYIVFIVCVHALYIYTQLCLCTYLCFTWTTFHVVQNLCVGLSKERLTLSNLCLNKPDNHLV